MKTLIETKMQNVVLKINEDNNDAQLTLDMCDVYKLQEMMSEIHELSLNWLNENHEWFNNKINEDIKNDNAFRNANIRLSEFVNKAMLVIGQSGDFAGVLSSKMDEVIKTV